MKKCTKGDQQQQFPATGLSHPLGMFSRLNMMKSKVAPSGEPQNEALRLADYCTLSKLTGVRCRLEIRVSGCCTIDGASKRIEERHHDIFCPVNGNVCFEFVLKVEVERNSRVAAFLRVHK